MEQSFGVSTFSGCNDKSKVKSKVKNKDNVKGVGQECPTHMLSRTTEYVDWICAVAEENWWEELRGDPKRLGEVSQAAFLLKARMLGLSVAIPWGDSDANDFVVWSRNSKSKSKASDKSVRPTRVRPTSSVRATSGGLILRVQVKGTGRLYRRGYEVQPVRSTRGGGKKRYTKKDIDVLVAHVQPVDAWYVIPIEKVGRAKSLRLYPGIESRNPRWEQWRDRWDLLGKR